MPIDIEVAGYFRKGEDHTVQLGLQDYLTAKARIVLQQGSLIKHIVFLFKRLRDEIIVSVVDVDVARRASERCFASAFKINFVAMGKVEYIVAFASCYFNVSPRPIYIRYRDSGERGCCSRFRGVGVSKNIGRFEVGWLLVAYSFPSEFPPCPCLARTDS